MDDIKVRDIVWVRGVVERIDDDGEVRVRLSTSEAISVPREDVAKDSQRQGDDSRKP